MESIFVLILHSPLWPEPHTRMAFSDRAKLDGHIQKFGKDYKALGWTHYSVKEIPIDCENLDARPVVLYVGGNTPL